MATSARERSRSASSNSIDTSLASSDERLSGHAWVGLAKVSHNHCPVDLDQVAKVLASSMRGTGPSVSTRFGHTRVT